MENTTNVIYITSNCNLACEYCYEEQNRPSKTMTYDDIDRYFEYINEHSAPHSHIVLFGGEPLLYPNLIEYIVNKVNNEYAYKQYSMSMNTNGLRLLEDEIYEWYKQLIKDKYIHLNISYDGPHSHRRIDKRGNCVNTYIENVLNKLDNDIKYSISYTLNKDNYCYCIEDIIELLEYHYIEKITISVMYKEIDKMAENYNIALQRLKPYFNEIFKRYHKSICAFTCELCQHCVFNNKNIYGIPSSQPIERPKFVKNDFDLWENVK